MADLKLPRLNKVFLAGRITHDLELKYTPKGTPVLKFNMASDRVYKDETGQWQTQTSYIDVIAWSNHAETLYKMAHKGCAVMVEGRIETRNYVDQNNQNRKAWEVVAEYVQTLEWKPREEGVSQSDIPLPEEPAQYSSAPAQPPTTTNDDVPF